MSVGDSKSKSGTRSRAPGWGPVPPLARSRGRGGARGAPAGGARSPPAAAALAAPSPLRAAHGALDRGGGSGQRRFGCELGRAPARSPAPLGHLPRLHGHHGVQRGGRHQRRRLGGGRGDGGPRQKEAPGLGGHRLAHVLQYRHDRGVRAARGSRLSPRPSPRRGAPYSAPGATTGWRGAPRAEARGRGVRTSVRGGARGDRARGDRARGPRREGGRGGGARAARRRVEWSRAGGRRARGHCLIRCTAWRRPRRGPEVKYRPGRNAGPAASALPPAPPPPPLWKKRLGRVPPGP